MSNKIITTLHPQNDENIDLYPNILPENIPDDAVDNSKIEDGSVSYNKLSNDVKNLLGTDGSPKGVYSTLTALQTAFPSGASGIYVVTENAHWYYWNGTAWTDGGAYTSTPFVTDMPDDTNIDTFTTNGVFLASVGDVTGGTLPTGVIAFYLLNAYTSIYKHYQILISTGDSTNGVSNMYIRNRVNVWREWKKIPYTNDINDIIANYNVRNKIAVKYTSGSGVDSSTEKMDVYIPQNNKYIHYVIVHTIDDDINADIWRVAYAYKCGLDFVDETQLTTTGEWELALKMLGKDDFMGGYMHGDEILTSVSFLANGLEWDKSIFSSTRYLDSFGFIQQSNLYDADDHTTAVAKHYSYHIFDLKNEKQLIIKQRVHWLMNLTMSIGYMAMFPIAKSNSVKYFTDIEYLAKTTPSYAVVNGVTETNLYVSDLPRVSSIFGIKKYPDYSSGNKLLISDNGGTAYNKCYYVIGENITTSTDADYITETYYNFNFIET